jgi:hypothetical protein
MHPALLTAAGYDGSNPAVALDLLGGLVSLPLAAHGRHQPRRQGGTGTGEGVHQGVVRMRAGKLVNLSSYLAFNVVAEAINDNG